MRRSNAYFTVEAAIIFPLVTGALILMIFLFVFQYDRCLLEQDISLLTLYAATLEADNTQDAAELIRRRAAELSKEKYIAWEPDELRITLKESGVRISGAGRLTFPLPGWNFFDAENGWKANVLRESAQLSPADFIRIYRRIQEEITDAD
ncbi:MAG: hypothetical protein NC541_12610 [bacterium]|nr:hypothetical protein [bacterium]